VPLAPEEDEEDELELDVPPELEVAPDEDEDAPPSAAGGLLVFVSSSPHAKTATVAIREMPYASDFIVRTYQLS
jgi:hypothetical protein